MIKELAWTSPDLDLDERKSALLDILRTACPSRHQFDEKRAWRRIELLAFRYPTTPSTTPRDRRDKLEDLGNAVTRSRKKLEELIRQQPNGTISDAAGYLVDAWLQLKPDGAVSRLFELRHGPWEALAELARLVEILKVLEAATVAAFEHERNNPGRGNRTTPRVLPLGTVCDLAVLYSEVTGQKPTSHTGGKFDHFVCAVMGTLGVDLADEEAGRLASESRRQSVMAGLRLFREEG